MGFDVLSSHIEVYVGEHTLYGKYCLDGFSRRRQLRVPHSARESSNTIEVDEFGLMKHDYERMKAERNKKELH